MDLWKRSFRVATFLPLLDERDAIECLQKEISHREKATKNNKVKKMRADRDAKGGSKNK